MPHSCAPFARIVQFYNSVYGLVCHFIFTITDHLSFRWCIGRLVFSIAHILYLIVTVSLHVVFITGNANH
jgi:hypothetical protein